MADKTLISQGQWLGIDVGSRRDKVFNFCSIKSDGKGQIELCFEVGKARGAFPRSNARCFADLSRETTWLSAAAENGSVQILEESALVKTWNAARNFGNGCFGVCIDAPCGFAVPGSDRRNTESQLVDSFLTPPLVIRSNSNQSSCSGLISGRLTASKRSCMAERLR